MAAELTTLVSSFLESRPESYAPFFLECVDSKQHLSGEVSKYHNLFCFFFSLTFSDLSFNLCTTCGGVLLLLARPGNGLII